MGEDGLQSCDMEVLQEWFGGVERLDALRIFLEKLVEVGVSTVIVTYGMPKLVKILLDRCGFLDSKYGIRGIFGCVRPGILYNKAQALIAIYEAMTDGKAFSDHRHEVLFADDSRSNIEAIERECDLPDEQNMLIDKNTAMTQEHMDIILEFFQGVAAKAGPSGAIGSSISGGTAGKDSASQQEDPGIPMLNQDQQETRTSPSSRSSSEYVQLTLMWVSALEVRTVATSLTLTVYCAFVQKKSEEPHVDMKRLIHVRRTARGLPSTIWFALIFLESIAVPMSLPLPHSIPIKYQKHKNKKTNYNTTLFFRAGSEPPVGTGQS